MRTQFSLLDFWTSNQPAPILSRSLDFALLPSWLLSRSLSSPGKACPEVCHKFPPPDGLRVPLLGESTCQNLAAPVGTGLPCFGLFRFSLGSSQKHK